MYELYSVYTVYIFFCLFVFRKTLGSEAAGKTAEEKVRMDFHKVHKKGGGFFHKKEGGFP